MQRMNAVYKFHIFTLKKARVKGKWSCLITPLTYLNQVGLPFQQTHLAMLGMTTIHNMYIQNHIVADPSLLEMEVSELILTG